MKVIADLPDYVVSRIRRFIADEKYKSISDFLIMAAENQLALESEKTSNFIDAPNLNQKNVKKDFSIENLEVPFLKINPLIEEDNIWDSWMWGQINRIFPIKFAIRVLAIESSKSSRYPEKAKFNETVSKMARDLGVFLSDIDSDSNTERDAKLSTGFPFSEKMESSINRYWSQFVGYQKKDKTLTGAFFDLALANLFTDENGLLRIGLNSEGVKFAKLENPILDKNNFSSSLSEFEQSFYLSHIKHYVPGEFSLFSILLKLLNNGIERREEMNKEIAKLVEGSGWSKGFISTQRAGGISRLYELNMISKKRVGLEVYYHITEKGKAWIDNETP